MFLVLTTRLSSALLARPNDSHCRYNRCGDPPPPCCIVFRIDLCDNLMEFYFKLFAYNARIKFSIFVAIAPPIKTNKLINFRLYRFNFIILYTTSMLHEIWLNRHRDAWNYSKIYLPFSLALTADFWSAFTTITFRLKCISFSICHFRKYTLPR